MNTSVPWSIKDISSEAREAAADAARRAGVPLGDWLDSIIAERTDHLGVPRAKPEDRERFRALATDMSRPTTPAAAAIDTSSNRALGESPAAGFASRPSPSDSLRIMSRRLADLEARASGGTGDAVVSDAPPIRPRAARSDKSANPAVREAVAEIARRQAALEEAGLVEPTGGSDASPPAPAGEAESPRRRHWRDGAGETWPTPDGTRAVVEIAAPTGDTGNRRGPATDAPSGLDELKKELRQAIKDIDPRGDVQELNRHVRSLEGRIEAVASIIPPGSVLSAIGEQTREVRDLLAAAAARPAPPDTLQTQIADIRDRLGDLGKAERDASRADDWTEMRTLLDRVASGSALETIDRRIQDLSAKLDAGLGDRSPSPLLEDLARRIEHIQTSLGAPREAALDTRPLEALVRGIGERIETAKLASTNVDQLERMVDALSDRIERSRNPIDTQALEAQITRLGNRLEQSQASLSALDSVEHTLSELFTQLEHTRTAAIDAAENAARTAARDTLRAAMQNQSGVAQSADPAAFEEVRQVLSEVRDQHDASDRRTQSTLRGLHQTMEQLVEHLTKLDAADRMPAPSAKPEAAAPVIVAPAIETPRAPAVSPQPQTGPSYQERFRQERTARRTERTERTEDTVDTLIEPGTGRKTRDGEADDAPAVRRASAAADAIAPPPREGQGAASYIAAARRAAQAAQASAAAQKQTKVSRGFGDKSGSPVLTRARSFLALRRRPILLSVAALVLLLGALEVVKVGLEEPPQRVGALEPSSAEPAPAGATEPASRTANVAGDANSPAPVVDGRPQSMADAVAGPAAETGGPSVAKALPGSSNPFLAGLDASPAGQSDGLRKLAASGEPTAQYELGLRYAEGRTLTRDPKAAAGWFEKAAAQGLAPAQYRIGSAYEKGIGVARNPALAMTWYGRAADAGNIKAMHNLAVMSADGSLGKPDYAKAATWFGKAAALGVRDSQFNLAILYAKGLGIESSLAQSYTWFAIAAAQGDDDAGKKRDEVGSKLDAKSLAAAKAAADAFRPGASIGAANDVAPPPGGWDSAAPAPKLPAGAQKATSAKVTTM